MREKECTFCDKSSSNLHLVSFEVIKKVIRKQKKIERKKIRKFGRSEFKSEIKRVLSNFNQGQEKRKDLYNICSPNYFISLFHFLFFIVFSVAKILQYVVDIIIPRMEGKKRE